MNSRDGKQEAREVMTPGGGRPEKSIRKERRLRLRDAARLRKLLKVSLDKVPPPSDWSASRTLISYSAVQRSKRVSMALPISSIDGQTSGLR